MSWFKKKKKEPEKQIDISTTAHIPLNAVLTSNGTGGTYWTTNGHAPIHPASQLAAYNSSAQQIQGYYNQQVNISPQQQMQNALAAQQAQVLTGTTYQYQ